jgi:hypothetical protein
MNRRSTLAYIAGQATGRAHVGRQQGSVAAKYSPLINLLKMSKGP